MGEILFSSTKIVFYLLLLFGGLIIVILILSFIPKIMAIIVNWIKNLIVRKKQKSIPLPILKPTLEHIKKISFDIAKMSGLEFEEFTAKIFELIGYKTINTQATRDGGVDIKAKMKDETYFIQCKRYKEETKIGVDKLRKFLGTMRDGKIEKGFFITTSYFTDEAEKFAIRNNIKLIDKKIFDKLKQFLESLNWEELKEIQK